jgi:hypothetical protein
MLAQYRAVEAYIAAIIAVTPAASLQELQRSQLDHLKMSIIRCPVEDSTAATPLLEALALPSAAFIVDQQQELCLFIASRNAGQSSVAQGKRAPLQVCLNFPHFLTDPQWDRLISLVPVDEQISFLVDIMLNIGLRNPKLCWKLSACRSTHGKRKHASCSPKVRRTSRSCIQSAIKLIRHQCRG